jgi:hypothetical protein
MMGGHAYVHIDIWNYTSVQPEESGNSTFAAVNLGFMASQEKLWPRGSGKRRGQRSQGRSPLLNQNVWWRARSGVQGSPLA